MRLQNFVYVFVAGFLLSGCGGIEAAQERPNVLIILLDALRADHVGCYGYERNTTPNIDAFARDSIMYSNCYATCSWTKPSVTSLLTGLNCRQHGVLARWDPLREDLPYLPAELQARGYETAGFIDSCFVLENREHSRILQLQRGRFRPVPEDYRREHAFDTGHGPYREGFAHSR